MKTYAIYTLGCKVNTYESNAIGRTFEAYEYQEVDFKDKADVYIINTCTVTNTGDTKSRKIIRQAIKRNPEAIICVMGCYAQVNPDEIMAIEGVDIVIGTQYRHKLVEMVEAHDKAQKFKHVDDILKTKQFEDFELETYTSNQRAYLKIQEGCNKFCTYCIIPYARGLMRSRDKDSIIKEANNLVQRGYHEIILTGIHTAGYGEDLKDYSFDDLLEDIIKEVPGLKRLRISSIEVSQISERTLEIFKNNEVIVKHFHIPVQAGSQEILHLMKRNYTKDEYHNKIKEIKAAIPGVAITTDLIVGFPGEDEKLFEESYQFMQDCGFCEIHTFPYSRRKGTIAYEMDNHVDEQVKKKHVESIIQLSNKLKRKYTKEFIDKEVDVIVEGYDDELKMYHGHSSNYIDVYFEADDTVTIGDLVDVRIKENLFVTKGELV
jgi:threonylcarbamoyladenosine tRNA methylthiotransferase MtaB